MLLNHQKTPLAVVQITELHREGQRRELLVGISASDESDDRNQCHAKMRVVSVESWHLQAILSKCEIVL